LVSQAARDDPAVGRRLRPARFKKTPVELWLGSRDTTTSLVLMAVGHALPDPVVVAICALVIAMSVLIGSAL
jgi:hypothetical protein